MRVRHLTPISRRTLLCLGLLLTALLGEVHAAPRLSRSDFYRYSTYVKQHMAAPADAAALPFPGLEGAARTDTVVVDEDRLSMAARSLQSLEDFLVREWKRTQSFSANQYLTAARSYRDVGEYDEALRWYRRASRNRRDTSARGPELRREMFAVAVLSGDSLQVTEELLNLTGLSELADDGGAVELAFRWLLVNDDRNNLDHLLAKLDGHLDEQPVSTRFWYAYTMAARGDRDACLAALVGILGAADGIDGLDADRRGWVLRTYADLHYLAGLRDDALRLYNLLADVAAPEVGGWARYQLANHHFIAGEYDAAGDIYDTFCGLDEATGWRERACEMATLVRSLDGIRKEGEPYGTDVIHTR